MRARCAIAMTMLLMGAWGARAGESAPLRVDEAPLDRDALKELARAPQGASINSPIGRAFRLTLPFEEIRRAADASPATWSFNAASRSLTFSFSPTSFPDGPGIELDRLELAGRRLDVVEAGGRARQVQALRVRVLTADFTTLPSADGASLGSGVFQQTLKAVTPAEVAGLSVGSQVELVGRVTGYVGVGPSRCSLSSTLRGDQPSTLVNRVSCAVGVQVDRVAFLTAQGRQLASWPAAQSQSANASATPHDAAPINSSERPDEQQASGGAQVGGAPSTTSSAAQMYAQTRARSESTSADEPLWLAYPSPELVERNYPLAAYAAGRSGRVELSCLEIEDGSVTECRVLTETPTREGFGRAAILLSRWFRFAPVTSEGRPLRVRLRIPYEFEVTDDEGSGAGK